jgi:hypothetical protein
MFDFALQKKAEKEAGGIAVCVWPICLPQRAYRNFM